MSLSEELRHSLELTYDIPFEVKGFVKDNEPCFEIVPARSHESLFSIHLAYRNGIRLIMEMFPQKYSANMVRAMGAAEDEKKESFKAFSTIMAREGGKVNFSINENSFDPSYPEKWPTEWNQVALRTTVMPIKLTAEETPDYNNETLKWGKIFTGTVLSLLDIVPVNVVNEPDDQPDITLSGYEEGRKIKFLSNKYERNPINRFICLQSKGYRCSVCGFEFEKKYGEIGRGFIHVHHITPVSKMGEGYLVDPIRDLVPVCPNCHAMLHRTDPPLTVEELQKQIAENDKG